MKMLEAYQKTYWSTHQREEKEEGDQWRDGPMELACNQRNKPLTCKPETFDDDDDDDKSFNVLRITPQFDQAP